MPAPLPSSNKAIMDLRIKRLQLEALQPISFCHYGAGTLTYFATSAFGGKYVSVSFTPPVSIGIEAIGITIGQVAAVSSPVWQLAVQVSYLNVPFFGGASNLPVVEQGNIIKTAYYGRSQGTANTTNPVNTVNIFSKFPGNYFLQANIPIYCHFWMEDAGITAATSTVYATATLHTIQTDIKS